MANLFRYLKEDRILVELKAQKKGRAIREVASRMEDGPEISDFRLFLSRLFQQEAQLGTGVGKGVAIPHYRNDSVLEPVIGLGISQKGIAWAEGERVHLLVLIGWPEKHGQAYLKTVAEIARLLYMGSVRGKLLEARTPGEVLEILKGEDEKKEQVAC